MHLRLTRERPFIFVQDRLIYYLNNILIPNSYFREAELVTNLLITLVAAQYIFIILGMLHALCGQYFYFPFLIFIVLNLFISILIFVP